MNTNNVYKCCEHCTGNACGSDKDNHAAECSYCLAGIPAFKGPRFVLTIREYDTPTRLAYVAQIWDNNRPDEYRPVALCPHEHRNPETARRCGNRLVARWNR